MELEKFFLDLKDYLKKIKMKSNIKIIENNLKINFNNKKLLIQSLIHKSYNEKYNNEKLEFLGDRVIGLVIAKKLIASLYPDENEGAIDKKFSYLVNKKPVDKSVGNLI